jgi:4a-hydroxytetrahydrobiopterin dehydratase
MSPDVLEHAAVDEALTSRGLGWEREDDELVKKVRRADFAAALQFVNAVGELAEAANHHPDIEIRWDTVVLRLSTHSAGGITAADLQLAGQIDALAEG